MAQSLTEKVIELQRLRQSQPFYPDPIRSHDGMDINPYTDVVETCGYDFKQNVADATKEAFMQDLEDDQELQRLYRKDSEKIR